MILLINICKEKLHFYEFVKPVEDILSKNKIEFSTRHYKDLTNQNPTKADKFIICGTSLKDNDFLENIEKFSWIKNCKKPVLGICGGSHVIGLIFGGKIRRKKEIGLKEINIEKEFLGVKGKKQVYHLNQFRVLPEVWKHKTKPIYATLFHPEVRNKEIIEDFCRI
ncbi:hypothetical protein J4407_01550 [Candidatus Pacearchaeota archaeon]|nr:hypothetical protein [Candidatus Pacearchaeota archaeon]